MRHLVPSLLFAAAAAGQSAPNLIGVTLNTPLIHQSVHGTCAPLGSCAPLVLPPTTLNYWPGGTAWDSTTNNVWATTGQLLARIDPTSCAPSCGPIPCPKSSPAAEATGMDMYDAANELWVIDSAGIITRCTNSCVPAVLGSFNTGLALVPAVPIATSGITIDELNGLVFYSRCNYAVGSGGIYVAPLATPGAWFQVTPVSDCFTNPSLITGLACDAANSVIYWTNGRGTMRLPYTYNPAGPSVAFNFTAQTCCIQVAPFTDPYTDLSIRWGGATSTGTPCANGSCPACPMIHSLRNAPLLGTTLQLGLDQATPGTLALCAVDLGTCATVGPLVAPFCGQILVPVTAAMLLMGPNIPVGPGPCNASTTWFLPLPSNPIFVGTPLCSQCVSLCGASGTVGGGTQMSNCLSWVLQ